MHLSFGPEVKKEEVFTSVESYLGEMAVGFTSIDSERPWGGFFVIDESYTDKFISTYFPSYDKKAIKQFGTKLSPKILLVAPELKLSWQYHIRRAELWCGVSGPVGYVRSPDNTQGAVHELANGETVQFNPQERHRLVGLNDWGVVAEIWQHSDPNSPSNEEDIVRVQDDFGR